MVIIVPTTFVKLARRNGRRVGVSSEYFSFPRRIAILAAVVLGSTLYATTLLVASSLLPQMQGSFAATPDEIAWTTTFNILATAIVTPTTGFLVARFGRRRVMIFCVTGFTIATWLYRVLAALRR